MDRFPIIPHQTAGGGIECCGCIVAEAFNSPGESKMTLRCNECGLAVGTINTGILNDLVTLSLATEMDKFVPDPDHINALPGPLRKYVHDLETRADPAHMGPPVQEDEEIEMDLASPGVSHWPEQ